MKCMKLSLRMSYIYKMWIQKHAQAIKELVDKARHETICLGWCYFYFLENGNQLLLKPLGERLTGNFIKEGSSRQHIKPLINLNGTKKGTDIVCLLIKHLWNSLTKKLIRPLTSSLLKTQVIKTTCETHKGDETAKFGTWEHLQDKWPSFFNKEEAF